MCGRQHCSPWKKERCNTVPVHVCHGVIIMALAPEGCPIERYDLVSECEPDYWHLLLYLPCECSVTTIRQFSSRAYDSSFYVLQRSYGVQHLQLFYTLSQGVAALYQHKSYVAVSFSLILVTFEMCLPVVAI